MAKTAKSVLDRKRRHRRIRLRVSGTSERPRLNVFRSTQHIYAQIIDDVEGKTIVSASTIDKQVAPELGDKGKKAQAEHVGKVLAARAKDAGITAVIFDRGGFRYHGRVKALADGAREGGLKF